MDVYLFNAFQFRPEYWMTYTCPLNNSKTTTTSNFVSDRVHALNHSLISTEILKKLTEKQSIALINQFTDYLLLQH